MSEQARYFRVGLFVLGGVVLLTAALIILGGGALFEKPVVFETYLDESVQGLEVGSPVKYRGVQLGTVSYIGLVQDEYDFESYEDQLRYGQLVLVRMNLVPVREGTRHPPDLPELAQRLERMVERGLRLRLASLGITGLSYIAADYLDPEGYPPMQITWKPKNRYVPSAPSTLKGLTSAVDRIFERLEDLDIEEVVMHLDELLVKLGRAVEDTRVAELREEARRLLVDVRATSERFRQTLADAEMPALASRVGGTLDEAKATLVDVQRVIENSRYDFELALENLRVVTDDLRDVTSTAKSYPSFILLGKPPKEAEGVGAP